MREITMMASPLAHLSLYNRVIDVDLARLALGARPLPVDVTAEDSGGVLANVAALERVWERTSTACGQT